MDKVLRLAMDVDEGAGQDDGDAPRARDEERQQRRVLPYIDEKLANCSLDQDLARSLMGLLSRKEEEAKRLFRQEMGYTFEDDEEEMESEVEIVEGDEEGGSG